ncbi:MAG: SUMF1/EgtB/PvdO family nonheme iron enzyme [Treponema sp.]|jgi:formylglycine-generating enzyme required for sulfatase activity|nr:SUMF1/EgtB/PvdO family nonheme iron enzyme [Treponema sp.]
MDVKFSVRNIAVLVFLSFLLVFTGCPQPPGGGEEEVNSVPVVINVGANGTVTASPSSGFPGDEITLRVIPDPGYRLVNGSFLANGVPVNTETRKVIIPEEVAQLAISASFEALTRVPVYPPDSTETFAGPRFGMVNVIWPAYGNARGIIFPVTTTDILRGPPYFDNPASFETIADSFLMGTTEVTYALWHAVRSWNDSGAKGYSFANSGRDGSDGAFYPYGNAAGTNPVTNITWYDAVIFCNALTEMYNEKLSPSPSLLFAYYRDEHFNNPVKSSYKSDLLLKPAEPGASGTIKTAFVRPFRYGGGANLTTGFRLPTKTEWEYAARLQGPEPLFFEAIQGIVDQGVTNQYFTPGSYAAGATAEYKNAHVTGMVAWYGANAGGRAQSVGQKVPTSIGLYDISGNVWEWCYEDSGQEHLMRGGSWRDGSSYLQIGSLGDFPRPDPVTPNPADSGDPNYHSMDLTNPDVLALVISTYKYDPTNPAVIREYDPMLDPNLSDITTLTVYLAPLGYTPVGSTARERMDDALLKYFTYWGDPLRGNYLPFCPTDDTNPPYTSSTEPPPATPYFDPRLDPLYPYNKDYATRYDPRFDPRNPHYNDQDLIDARAGYDEDTGRKGDTIGFRIIRNRGF